MAKKVGGEVDAFCTKCKLTLAHTVLAMVGSKIARVRCNTCGGDHVYRTDPTTKPAASERPARERAEKVVVSFEQQLAGKNASSARPYSPKETYQVEDVVRHPTFGLGIVTAVRGEKVDIAFKADQKTLVHGRAPGEARPAFQPPASRADLPADKPLPPGAEDPG